jgi:hypothetical protein
MPDGLTRVAAQRLRSAGAVERPRLALSVAHEPERLRRIRVQRQRVGEALFGGRQFGQS